MPTQPRDDNGGLSNGTSSGGANVQQVVNLGSGGGCCGCGSGGGWADTDALKKEIQDLLKALEWQDSDEDLEIPTGLVPTIVDGSHFTVPGDQTGVLKPGMRIIIGGKTVVIKTVTYDPGSGTTTIETIENTLDPSDTKPGSIIIVKQGLSAEIEEKLTDLQKQIDKLRSAQNIIETGIPMIIIDSKTIHVPGDQTGALKAGDFIQIGGVLYEVESATFDGTNTIIKLLQDLGAVVPGTPLTIVKITNAGGECTCAGKIEELQERIDQQGVKPDAASMQQIQNAITAAISAHNSSATAHSSIIADLKRRIEELEGSVTVTVPVTGVNLNTPTVQLAPGGQHQLAAAVAPANATNKAVTWTSGNAAVATVSAAGLVTAVADGSAAITVTTTDGGKSAVCNAAVQTVVVTKPVTGVVLDAPSVALERGATRQLTATVSPADATNKAVTWSSSNTGVATVNASGLVTSVGSGSATITVTTADGGKQATSAFAVSVAVTGVTVAPTSFAGAVGLTENLTATVSPADATDKTITWSSNDTAVATVSAAGLVTIVGGGNATVTARSTNGKTATCAVSAPIVVTSVSVSPTSLALKTGGTAQLYATVSPSNVADKSVTWTSSKTDVSTVNAAGVVTAVGIGGSVITATSSNGKKGVCNAIVTAPVVTQISGVPGDYGMTIGSVAYNSQIKLGTIPATNVELQLTSSNPSVVQAYPVRAGLPSDVGLRAMSPGNATITVRAPNGVTASFPCRVVSGK